jgi:hypothetical protein
MSSIETDKSPKPQRVSTVDPNLVAPIHPDPALQPDTIFHGGSGKTPPPQPKAATKAPEPSMDGRGIHDATGSYTHQAGDNPAAQPPPVKTGFAAPKRKGD